MDEARFLSENQIEIDSRLTGAPSLEITNTLSVLGIQLTPQTFYPDDYTSELYGCDEMAFLVNATEGLRFPVGSLESLLIFGITQQTIEKDTRRFASSYSGNTNGKNGNFAERVACLSEWIRRDPLVFYRDQLSPILKSQMYTPHWTTTELFLYLVRECAFPTDNGYHLPSFFTTIESLGWHYCADAEYFLFRAADDNSIDSKRVVVYVDQNNQPVFLQKLEPNYPYRKGSTHTAITLSNTYVNKRLIPAGMLVGITTTSDNGPEDTVNNCHKPILGINEIHSVVPLRPTLFMIPPEEREEFYTQSTKDLLNNTFGQNITVEYFVTRAREISNRVG